MLWETSIEHEFDFTLKELSWVSWKIIVFNLILFLLLNISNMFTK